MNIKVILLIVALLFTANCALQLPANYIEIYLPKDVQLLESDIYFNRGVIMCSSIYWQGGGNLNPTLYRMARNIASSKLTYYYIELYGTLGIKAFIFSVTLP